MDPLNHALLLTAGGEKPEPTFVAFGSEWSSSINLTSFDIPVPAGVASGDLLIATIQGNGGDNDVSSWTPPSGWTTIQGYTTRPNNIVAYKVSDGTEGSTQTFTCGGVNGVKSQGIMWAYRGAVYDSTAGTSIQSTSSSTFSVSGITVSSPNSILMVVPAINASSRSIATPPTGMTSAYHLNTAANAFTSYVFTQSVNSGATGTRSATWSGGSATLQTIMFAINPA